MEIVKWVLVIALSAMIILSGIMKLVKNQKITEALTSAGIGNYISLLGIAEILFAAMFIYPATRNIGFIFLVCYFSGALATDLTHKKPLTAPLVFLILLFVTQYIYNPAIFF